MDVMSESFLPRNTGNCIASDGGRDPDGGVRDREYIPAPLERTLTWKTLLRAKRVLLANFSLVVAWT